MAFVTLERRGQVGVLTVTRPEALNALNRQVLHDLDEAIDRAAEDESLLVLILTGEGRAFVAGADIAEMATMSTAQAKRYAVYGGEILHKLETMQKPVIAAVNGFALGGGCELAMACDIRIAGEKARFGQPEVGLGIPPGFGGTQRLPRIVGASKAMELILTGRVIGAQEAREIGLVSEVCAQETLMERALALAAEICANAPIAVCQAKRCIRMGLQTDIVTGSAFEAEAFGVCFGTEDQREGMGAFLDKRKEKNFQNR